MFIRALKQLSAKTGLLETVVFNKYHYMFSPGQLRRILELIEETAAVRGSYVEVGCAYGATTITAKKYMDELGLFRSCYALDTFAGFVEHHASHDIDKLGQDSALKSKFKNNSIEMMRASLRASNVDGVEIIKGDATQFNYEKVAPIAFCLLDVDLYKPISHILPEIYEHLSPGGVIIVDDCQPSKMWEGALIAYNEYMASLGQPPEIVCRKLGLVRKS